MTQCPMCRRDLPTGVAVCPHCQRDLNVGPWTIGFVVLWLVLAASAALSYRQTAQLVRSQALVDHTHRVLAQLQSVLGTLTEAETAQRGFIITGDQVPRAYRAAAAAIPPECRPFGRWSPTIPRSRNDWPKSIAPRGAARYDRSQPRRAPAPRRLRARARRSSRRAWQAADGCGPRTSGGHAARGGSAARGT